ncbi:MAG: hypothetical protein K2H40_04345, partial [Lachnospiraceae bacterium]|nr:hypothetical protein [Lachnospiraceae bacterium]
MLKRRAVMPNGRKKVKMQIRKYAAAVMVICGLVGGGPFFLCAEAAQANAEMPEDGNTELLEGFEQGLVLEAE